MSIDLLDLDLTRLDVFILAIVPALINIGIYFYVAITFRKTRTILFFSWFVLLIGLWQVSEGFMRLARTIENAEFWYKISIFFLLFALPFGIEFVLRFRRKESKSKAGFSSSFFFIISSVFFIVVESGCEKHSILPSSEWHWIANPVPSFWTNLLLIWFAFNGISMVFLLWKYYLNNSVDVTVKKQAGLLLLGLIVPVIIGITIEILFPIFFNLNDIPLTAPTATIFSICALITINKYNIFDYSPKHQWEKIVTTLNDAILIVNNDDNVMYANESFCRLLGYKFEEVKGKNASDIFLLPEHKADIQKIIGERKQNKTSNYELPMVTKNKEIIWVMISGSPYLNQDGEIIGSIGIHTNISSLKSMNKELETFIYKASHDLRGPLASIIGLVSVSKLEGDSKNMGKYLDMIETASKKLDSTLTDLVKAMQFKEALRFNDEVELKKMITEILNRFTFYPGYSNLKVSVSISVEKSILTNKLILETILQNLIENSIKYQNSEINEPLLKIEINQTGNDIEFLIEDNGIGIDESVQSKIFDMYFRATNSAKGSGLGLYLVKNGIDKLRGRIEVRSKPGEKTIFKVSLPINK